MRSTMPLRILCAALTLSMGCATEALQVDAGASAGRSDSGSNTSDDASMNSPLADASAEDARVVRDAGGLPLHTFPERNFVCAAGATEPCPTTESASTDAERTQPLPGTRMSETQVWALTRLDIPRAAGGVALGFNLDSLDSGIGDFSGNCEESAMDYDSELEPDHVGVDNALAGGLGGVLEGLLGGVSLGAQLTQQICEGDLILLMEVSDIDDFQYDDAVEVQLLTGTVLSDSNPGLEGNQPECDVTGALSGGQTFGRMTPLGTAVTGDIYGGRLRVQTPLLPLAFSAGTDRIELTVTNAELRVDLLDGTNGIIGGAIPLDELSSAAAPIAMGFDVGSVVQNFADIRPSDTDPTLCEALSVGLSFEIKDAILEGS